VPYLEHLHGILQHRQHVQVGGDGLVGDVAMREDLAPGEAGKGEFDAPARRRQDEGVDDLAPPAALLHNVRQGSPPFASGSLPRMINENWWFTTLLVKQSRMRDELGGGA
jgi:hypothetical protein